MPQIEEPIHVKEQRKQGIVISVEVKDVQHDDLKDRSLILNKKTPVHDCEEPTDDMY